MQHIGIIRVFCLLRRNLLSFSVPGGPKKLAGFWFTRGITTQVDTMKDYMEVQKKLQDCVLLGGVSTQVDTMKDYLEVQKSLLGCGLLGGSVPRLTLWRIISRKSCLSELSVLAYSSTSMQPAFWSSYFCWMLSFLSGCSVFGEKQNKYNVENCCSGGFFCMFLTNQLTKSSKR